MRAWRRDIPEQTVVRQGSLVFCEAKVPKPNASECSRRSGMSVFAGDVPTPCSSLWISLSLYFPNTCFNSSVVLAAGLVRIFFSSSPTMKKSPSRAFVVT